MLLVLVAIPLLAASLAAFVPAADTRLRGRLLAWAAAALVLAVLVTMPRAWLPWPDWAGFGLGQGALDGDAEDTMATLFRARWLPTLGTDLSGGLRAVDVFVLLALAAALARVRPERGLDGTSLVALDGKGREESGLHASSWDIAARLGLVAAATGALLTTDAAVRAWCITFAWVASAIELGARSAGARRSGWGAEGLVGGVAVLATSCAAALQATAAGHAAFAPPLAADAAAAGTSPSTAVGVVMFVASMAAAVVLMGVFPVRRWAYVAGEAVDGEAEVLRDVAGWAMGIAVLRAAIDAAPGISALAIDAVLWVTALSLSLVALAFVGSEDPHTRRRLFGGFASTITFVLAAVPSRASWSVAGLVVLTFALAGVALAWGSAEVDPPVEGSAARREDVGRGVRPALAGGVAAGILLLPFGPGVVVWMVLGRGLSAPLPVGIAAIPMDGVAIAATWLAGALASIACLTALLVPSSAAVDATAKGISVETHVVGSAASRRRHSGRRALVVVASLALLAPFATAKLLAASDADAAWRFERWAHHRCQDEAARVSGRAVRSHTRVAPGTVDGPTTREDDSCGPAPTRRAFSASTQGSGGPGAGPFTAAAIAADTLQLQIAGEFVE